MSPASIFFAPDGQLRPSWRAVVFVPLYVFLSLLVSGIVVFVIGGELRGNPELSLAVGGMLSLLVAVLAAKLLLRFLDRRDFRSLGFWFYAGWALELGVGLAGGLLLISLVVGVQWSLGGVEFVTLAATAPVLFAAAVWNLVMLLPAAASEELLFRGYPFQRLVEAWGAWPATLVFAALFGALHLWNPSPTALSTLNTSLMGILLALAYLKTRGLWLPIGLHFAWNYALGFLYSLPLSGLRLEGILWQVEVAGPGWLTGGGYGPEGSLVTTLIALTAIIVLARTRRLRLGSASPPELQ
ncbi:MAG: lysostaphin resistance A-like protein [Terriglobia bacterium]